MRPLEHIPYDIWQLIFELVCTDGGAAGCALARTSRTFRNLSASMRFHSLRLTSLTQVKNLLICLERVRRFNGTDPSSGGVSSPIVVHHLLLSFVPPTCDAPPRTFRKWTDYARGDRALVSQLTHDHRAWAAAKAAWNRECVLHVSRLLQLAAPTLRTLALLQCAEVRLPLLAPGPARGLPALRELTLLADDRAFVRGPGPGALVAGQNDPSDFEFYGVPVGAHGWAALPVALLPAGTPTPTPTPPASTPTSTPEPILIHAPTPRHSPPFPALTHLHVVCTGPKLHGWERTLPLWAVMAPSLTHLRISQAGPRIPPTLAELLSVPPPPETPVDDALGFTPRLEPTVGSTIATLSATSDADLADELAAAPPVSAPTSLRTVVVQMSGARKSSIGGAHDPSTQELQRIADALQLAEGAEGGAVPRLVVLRSRAYMPGYWEARLAWDWRERMLGGGGCWTEDEADEHAWRTFPVPGDGARAGKKGLVAVNVAEVWTGTGGAQSMADSRPGKRWWSVLANGIARARRRGNAT